MGLSSAVSPWVIGRLSLRSPDVSQASCLSGALFVRGGRGAAGRCGYPCVALTELNTYPRELVCGSGPHQILARGPRGPWCDRPGQWCRPLSCCGHSRPRGPQSLPLLPSLHVPRGPGLQAAPPSSGRRETGRSQRIASLHFTSSDGSTSFKTPLPRNSMAMIPAPWAPVTTSGFTEAVDPCHH